jgi:hypothetical protein
MLFSLRPENIRVADAGGATSGRVRFRGRVKHRAFHGATELLQIESGDGLVFSVRAVNAPEAKTELECEFDPADAIPVRESAERA